MAKVPKVLLSTKIEEDMRLKLNHIAISNCVSLPDQVRLFLLAGIQEFERRNSKINIQEIKSQLELFGKGK